MKSNVKWNIFKIDTWDDIVESQEKEGLVSQLFVRYFSLPGSDKGGI